jgi:hypothetical protein
MNEIHGNRQIGRTKANKTMQQTSKRIEDVREFAAWPFITFLSVVF